MLAQLVYLTELVLNSQIQQNSFDCISLWIGVIGTAKQGEREPANEEYSLIHIQHICGKM